MADFLNISKSTACSIIAKVSRALANLVPHYIRMPETQECITQTQMEFYTKARLPRVRGSLDCIHIKLLGLGGEHVERFRNRKGYLSIDVQTVSSANLKILDIVARWPGSTRDQTIFDNSNIKQRFINQEFGDNLLVADSGYANTMHIITPLRNPENEVQNLYNEAVIRTRNPVERCYGVLKRRFPVLALGLRLKIDTTLAVIVACAVLHNIAIEQNAEMPPDEPEVIAQNADFFRAHSSGSSKC